MALPPSPLSIFDGEGEEEEVLALSLRGLPSRWNFLCLCQVASSMRNHSSSSNALLIISCYARQRNEYHTLI
jgi:hypothetical protein